MKERTTDIFGLSKTKQTGHGRQKLHRDETIWSGDTREKRNVVAITVSPHMQRW
jgi:hypothetical protein